MRLPARRAFDEFLSAVREDLRLTAVSVRSSRRPPHRPSYGLTDHRFRRLSGCRHPSKGVAIQRV